MAVVNDRTDTDFAGYIENASRYDGSRTPPQKIALIHAMKREGRSLTSMAEMLSMDERTIKAILARGDSLVSDARMVLQANALGFVGDAILASQKAAQKGKIEGISAMLDRLGVTEPPKSGAQTSVGVQVILHGGEAPAELSRAKVITESEGLENQAGNVEGLISQLTITAEVPISQSLTQTDAPSIAQDTPPSAPVQASRVHDATNVAELRKQA